MKNKHKKSKSRFINPHDGSYRRVQMVHKSKKKYDRKNIKLNEEEE